MVTVADKARLQFLERTTLALATRVDALEARARAAAVSTPQPVAAPAP
jgi:hypothetical protein